MMRRAAALWWLCSAAEALRACTWVNPSKAQWSLECPEHATTPMCAVLGARSEVFANRECWQYLSERLDDLSSAKWVAGWGRGDDDVQSRTRLNGRTLFFVGSSHMRTMLLDMLQGITGRVQDLHIASRSRSCPNLDGFDIQGCGWPHSKMWEIAGGRVLAEEKHVQPRTTFPPAAPTDAWRMVFQFKTFVDTPELDAMIVKQANGYRADALVLELGIWGWLAYEGGGDLEAQATRFFNVIRGGYDGTIVLVVDAYNFGHVGPHIVNGSEIAPVLLRVARGMQDVLVFDRTEGLLAAAKVERLQESMARHGYAGAVSMAHIRALLSVLCTGY